jgi:hypothetical protein
MARILIIDDDKSFREALAESIRDFGHDVVEASGAQEAFELINEVDAAFLDLNMPGISGMNPDGLVDGILLSDGTIVRFAPQMSQQLVQTVKLQDSVSVDGFIENQGTIHATTIRDGVGPYLSIYLKGGLAWPM